MSSMDQSVSSKGRLCSLDGLRGAGACVIAFLWHYQHFAPREGFPFYHLFQIFYDYGWLMVEVFFMLSGFGIAYGYEERIRRGSLSFGKYMGNRLKKLFPPMLATLAATTLLQSLYWLKAGTTFQYNNFDVYHFLLNFWMLQDGVLETGWSYNAPSWCIGILIWCYAVFYFMANRENENGKLLFQYIAGACAGAAAVVSQMDFPVFNSLMGRGFSCFFTGACLAAVYRNRPKLNERAIGYCCLLFLAAIGFLVSFQGYEALGNIQMVTVLGIAPALLISVLFVPWLGKVFGLKPLAYLGKISLAVYLWHFPVQCLWKTIEIYCGLKINFSNEIIWVMYILSVLAAAILYEELLAKKITGVIRKVFIRDQSSSGPMSF